MRARVAVTFRNEAKVLPYEAALRAVGLEPVRIAPSTRAAFDGLQGLVLTGGTDVNPARYNQPRDPATQEPDDERDEMETFLLQQALQQRQPVLAICRGMQLFNVVHGGTLVQDLKTTSHAQQPAAEWESGKHPAAHAVEVRPGTLLASIIGAGEHLVNSRHHQGVDQVGNGLRVAALSPDGLVEALERPDHPFAIAVQWHPEDRLQVSTADHKLLAAFARATQSAT